MVVSTRTTPRRRLVLAPTPSPSPAPSAGPSVLPSSIPRPGVRPPRPQARKPVEDLNRDAFTEMGAAAAARSTGDSTGSEWDAMATVEFLGGAPLSQVRWAATQEEVGVVVVGESYSPGQGCDAKRLNAGYNSLWVHSVRCGRQKPEFVEEHSREIGHSGGGVVALEVDWRGRIYSGHGDGQLKVTANAETSASCQSLGLFPRCERVAAILPRSDADGSLIVLGSSGSIGLVDSETELWKSVGQSELWSFQSGAVLEPSVFSGCGSGPKLSVWDVRSGPVEASCQTLRHPNGSAGVSCLLCDPAQPHALLGGCESGELAMWDRRGAGREGRLPLWRAAAHSAVVWDVRLVPRLSRRVTSCSEDGTVLLWDLSEPFAAEGAGRGGGVADGAVTQVAPTQALGVNAVSGHPGASILAYVSESGLVCVQRLLGS